MIAVSIERRAAVPIEAHVAIGDGRSVALTDGSGSIDWLCWPRFDSDAVFAAILDGSRGGRFTIAPREHGRSFASYVDGTNVAVTKFAGDVSDMELVDAMLIDDDAVHEHSLAAEHEMVRVLECTRGHGEVAIEFDPRPGFGARRARPRIDARGTVRFTDRGALYQLRSSRRVRWVTGADQALRCSVYLRAGERIGFSLSYAADAPLVISPLVGEGQPLVEETIGTWRRWSRRAHYSGPYHAHVVRSALALKLLCYAPSGAIIAAPTTSLPEQRWGDRNWDYRYCWLRDASFTVRALFGLGYQDEADAFVGWLLHATRLTRPRLRVLYDVFGGAPQSEREVTTLQGYDGARPVRVGNAAADQRQLDVYGEVIDAVAQACRHGRDPDHAELDFVRELGHEVATTWREADHGIWEGRTEPQHHVHSRVLCWVALDRLLDLSARGTLRLSPEETRRFETERTAIAHEVRTRGWSEALGSYVSILDGTQVDAALLLLSWYGFEDASSPRMVGTRAAIERDLGVGHGLVRRNASVADDGGFVACAFWAAEDLARGGGTIEEARAKLETILSLAASSGLYGEVVDATGRHLGNYPQGFSHLALVNAALSLERRMAER